MGRGQPFGKNLQWTGGYAEPDVKTIIAREPEPGPGKSAVRDRRACAEGERVPELRRDVVAMAMPFFGGRDRKPERTADMHMSIAKPTGH